MPPDPEGDRAETKAVIPVHIYGQPADMDPILEIAKKEKPRRDRGRMPGSRFAVQGQESRVHGLGRLFQLLPGKNLGAYGEGGAVVTRVKT